MIPAPPPRPPLALAADEPEMLTQFLEYYRDELLGRAADLTPAQLNTTTGASTLTLGGLIKHMATVEDWWFEYRFAGRDEPEPGRSAPEDEPDWDFDSAADDTPDQLATWYLSSCARSRHVVASATSLDDLSARTNIHGEHWNLRWILVHMIEEYARHCGHADLIRESIDGVVG